MNFELGWLIVIKRFSIVVCDDVIKKFLKRMRNEVIIIISEEENEGNKKSNCHCFVYIQTLIMIKENFKENFFR